MNEIDGHSLVYNIFHINTMIIIFTTNIYIHICKMNSIIAIILNSNCNQVYNFPEK